jgi:hypothetical protein
VSIKFKNINRQFLFAAIILLYLIPLLFFSAYSISLMSHHKSWTLLSLGLLLIVFGTLALIFLLIYWEQSVRDKKTSHFIMASSQKTMLHPLLEKETKVSSLDSSLIFNQLSADESPNHLGLKEPARELNLLQEALKVNQDQQNQLALSLDAKNQELHQLGEENKHLLFKVQKITQDFADYKLFSEEQLKQKQLQLTTLQQIIEDQRSEMEKRQEQIHQLDTKVHDLSYEIKTLLYLHEEETGFAKTSALIKKELPYSILQENETESKDSSLQTLINTEVNVLENPIRTPIEAFNLLKKCINTAQKLTGANYYSNESSRYREFSSSFYAIDQRRLFDNLRSETRALIIVYSQKEHKLLFVNNESKTMLGWSPEKFVADFSIIMHEGINEWKKALSLLATTSDSQVRLLAKTKNGEEILLNCHLSVIPTGLFRHYLIGILYPT